MTDISSPLAAQRGACDQPGGRRTTGRNFAVVGPERNPI
jgi:hypothetical protein